MDNHSSVLPLLQLPQPADELKPRWCDSRTRSRVTLPARASAVEMPGQRAGLSPAPPEQPLPSSSSPVPPAARGAQPQGTWVVSGRQLYPEQPLGQRRCAGCHARAGAEPAASQESVPVSPRLVLPRCSGRGWRFLGVGAQHCPPLQPCRRKSGQGAPEVRQNPNPLPLHPRGSR